jgi:CRISPR/Cas system CMR subunit Cmr6 (Cas7 group RAMP superfamily)
MDDIVVTLSVPDPAYNRLQGVAAGDTLRFVSQFGSGFRTSSGFGSYEGEFKFYAD